MRGWRSAPVIGRRYARFARVDRICCAHAVSAAVDFGWQTKSRRRLGVLSMPLTLTGPLIATWLNFGGSDPTCRSCDERKDGSKISCDRAGFSIKVKPT